MSPSLAERPMARRNDVPVKIDAEVVRKAKIVAAYRDIPLAEYVSETLRGHVEKDLENEQEKERKARGGKGGKSSTDR